MSVGRKVGRMSRADLEAEVLSLRMIRLRGGRSSNELLDARADLRATREMVDRERTLRVAAEKNAARFHALMLQARINLLAAEKKEGAR